MARAPHHAGHHAGHLVALLGPTASGKTAAAVAAAGRLPVEVISADSRQVRRGMRIGTAAPTDEECRAVRHHLVGIVEPDEPFTLVDWLALARRALDEIWARGGLPLLIAGTGQYAWALLEGWQVPEVPPDPERRAALESFAQQHGASALHARLAALDPASAARIPPANMRRVIRAIEIVEATGAPVPPLDRRDPGFTWRAVGLRWPRESLHRRADARVERMYAGGLMEETRTLIERHGDAFPALQSIGYAEARRVLAGELDLPAAIEQTKIATHRLVRMQASWFREDDERIEWVPGDDRQAIRAAVEVAARAPVR